MILPTSTVLLKYNRHDSPITRRIASCKTIRKLYLPFMLFPCINLLFFCCSAESPLYDFLESCLRHKSEVRFNLIQCIHIIFLWIGPLDTCGTDLLLHVLFCTDGDLRSCSCPGKSEKPQVQRFVPRNFRYCSLHLRVNTSCKNFT